MTETNILIAEFMGYEFVTFKNKKYCKYKGLESEEYTNANTVDDLSSFETSWDWLMPVVEKIEKETVYEIQSVYDGREEFIGWEPVIFTLLPKDSICQSLEDYRYETKIEATYKAVVEFIKWYNENKTK